MAAAVLKGVETGVKVAMAVGDFYQKVRETYAKPRLPEYCSRVGTGFRRDIRSIACFS